MFQIKKQLLYFYVLLLMPTLGFNIKAQDFHVQTGTTFSAIKNKWGDKDKGYTTDYLTGFAFHVGVDYLKKKSFNLSSNIGYVRKGFREHITFQPLPGEDTQQETGRDLKLHRDCLHLNTLANYHFPLNEKLSFFVNLGPYVGFPVGGDDFISDTVLFGLLPGGGFKYNFDTYQLGIVFNYYWDFNHLDDYYVDLPVYDNNTVISTSRTHFTTDFKAFALQMYFAFKL